MAKIKHTIKCRKCGHVYDTRVCDLDSFQKEMEDIIITTGTWMISGRKCSNCGSPIKVDSSPTIEIDAEQLEIGGS